MFTSNAKNLPGVDTNGTFDIAFRDMTVSAVEKVSVGLDADANGPSSRPSVSDNGNFVTFQSGATDLVQADTNQVDDVFVRSRMAKVTTRMSVSHTSQQLPQGGLAPTMSPGGTRVGFITASAAVPGDTNQMLDLYIREAGATRRVSSHGFGNALKANVLAASVGDHSSAWTTSDRAVSFDTNNLVDAYVRHEPFVGPFGSLEALAAEQLAAFGKPVTPKAFDDARVLLRSGVAPAAWVMTLVDEPAFSAKKAPVVRLYWAYFKRRPDLGGLNFWLKRHEAGMRLVDISQQFAKSSEFKNKYGNTTSAAFVTLVYQNVLERNPEPNGLAYWAAKIDQGVPRGQVMTNFSESSEGKRVIGPRSDAILTALGMYAKVPSPALFDAIVAARQQGEPRETTVLHILGAPEYHAAVK